MKATAEGAAMDDRDPWSEVSKQVDALMGRAPVEGGATPPSLPLAVLGAALAVNRFRNDETPTDPPPRLHATPWGSVVSWWSGKVQRQVEVVSPTEAWEYLVHTVDGRLEGSVLRFSFDARMSDEHR